MGIIVVPVYGSFFTNGYSPVYEIVFTAQLVVGFINTSTTVVTFSYAAVLAFHACGQFEVVILFLNDLIDGNNQKEKSVDAKLIVTINQHLKVLR